MLITTQVLHWLLGRYPISYVCYYVGCQVGNPFCMLIITQVLHFKHQLLGMQLYFVQLLLGWFSILYIGYQVGSPLCTQVIRQVLHFLQSKFFRLPPTASNNRSLREVMDRIRFCLIGVLVGTVRDELMHFWTFDLLLKMMIGPKGSMTLGKTCTTTTTTLEQLQINLASSSSVTRLGDLSPFGRLFTAGGNNILADIFWNF